MKIFALLIFAPLFLWAQTPGILHAGPKGVFLTLGDHPAGMKHDTYLIERSEGGPFKKMVEISAVKDVVEFRKNMEDAQRWVDYPLDLRGFCADSIWSIVKKTGTVNSLKAIGHSFPVLSGFKLLWLDKDVKIGKTYQYRVTAKGYHLLSEKFEYQLPALAPLELQSYRFLKGVFHFTFSSYGKAKPQWIEIFRGQSEKPLERIKAKVMISSSKDTLLYFIQDSSAQAYHPYRYSFKAYDPYGNSNFFPNTIHTASLDPTLLPLPQQVTVHPNDVGLTLKWKMAQPELLKTIVIERGHNTAGPFEPLTELSPLAIDYKDETAQSGTTYFYRFKVAYKGIPDTKMSTLYSGIRLDLTPPAPVPVFEGEETSTGTNLRWTIQDHCAGFHLYRQINNGGFHLLTDLLPSKEGQKSYAFLDPHAGQGKIYQYYLTPLSKSYVEGPPSDTLTIRSHRSLPVPKVPINIVIQRIDEQNWLSWETMPDAAGYAILRQSTNRLDTLYTDKNYYTDTLNQASYRIKSLSIAGQSSSFSTAIKTPTFHATPLPPSSLSARPLRSGGMIVQWEAPVAESHVEFHIYRFEKEKKPTRIAKTAESRYVDKSVIRGKTYYYFVRSLDANGKESENSRASTFTY